MTWVWNRDKLNKYTVLLLLFFIVGAMPAVMSDPIDSPDTHGTRIVNWDFTNKLDYLSDNITIEP